METVKKPKQKKTATKPVKPSSKQVEKKVVRKFINRLSVAQLSRMSSDAKIELIKGGISKNELEALKEQTGLGYEILSHILSISRPSLINKKGEDKFNQPVSDRVVALADIYSNGYAVFDDKDRFNSWMIKPNRTLGGKAPIDLLDTSYGMENVKHLIGRIAYGVYS